MAHFEKAHAHVGELEGGYSNDKNDTGGETFKGVSRNNFPRWQGWPLLDQYKSLPSFPQNALEDPMLQNMVKQWYKETFWDVFGLDALSSDHVACEVFEQSVNHGIGRGARHIQEACNALNYTQQFGPDLAVDGKPGPATRARLAKVANSSPQLALALANALNCLQGAFYVSLGNSQSAKSDYRMYTKGWLSKRASGYTEIPRY